MDQLPAIFEAFDYLDLMLAVFGAIIIAMWYGRGKSAWGILSGALMGGLVKPTIFLIIASGVIFSSQGVPELKQTQEQQDATIKFWTK